MPGTTAYQSLSGQLTNMHVMPAAEHGKAYHWPTSTNAALAFLNKSFDTSTSDANKAAMDSLEQALNAEYQLQADAETFQRSVAFAKAVAQRIFVWS